MGTGDLIQDGLVSAVKSVELDSDAVSCTDLRDRWCNNFF